MNTLPALHLSSLSSTSLSPPARSQIDSLQAARQYVAKLEIADRVQVQQQLATLKKQAAEGLIEPASQQLIGQALEETQQGMAKVELRSIAQAEDYLRTTHPRPEQLESLTALTPAELEQAVNGSDSYHHLMTACRTRLANGQDELSLEENINKLFNQLNPQQVKSDSSLTAALIRLTAVSNSSLGKACLKGLEEKLTTALHADEIWIRNDAELLLKLTEQLRLTASAEPEHLLQAVTCQSVQTCLPSFSHRDLVITDQSNVSRESANFNRLLPTIGMAAQRYGYLGRKIILAGAASLTEGDRKAERYAKFDKVVMDQAPSEESVNQEMSDYYMGYVMQYGDELDEPC